MTEATNQQAKPKKLCTYCCKPIETLVKREIFYRGYDHIRSKQVAKREHMEFCSAACGGNYQMGCEG